MRVETVYEMDHFSGREDEGPTGVPAEVGALSRKASGQLAGIMFMVSGVVTGLSPLLPSPPALNRHAVILIGALAFTFGVGLLGLPWSRMPARASLWIGVPMALVLISFHNYFGESDPYRYSIFYSVLFVWIGVSQPRRTGFLVSPALLVSYLVPLLLQHTPAWARTDAVMTIPVMVLIAESISWLGQNFTTAKAELIRLAGTDPLTGLDNRATFYRQLGNVWEAPGPVTVLFLDLDGFKAINDAHGHELGDQLLVEVAGRLRAAARVSDRIARLGGDEFVLLAHSIRDAGEAEGIAGRILEHMQEPFVIAGLQLRLSFSVGIAIRDNQCPDPEQLVRRSDVAMYSAKRSGGGRFCLAAPPG